MAGSSAVCSNAARQTADVLSRSKAGFTEVPAVLGVVCGERRGVEGRRERGKRGRGIDKYRERESEENRV